MTNEEQIKTYFDAIVDATNRCFDRAEAASELVPYIRRHLVEIERLLQEPEPKSGTIVRLTEENRQLKTELALWKEGYGQVHNALERIMEQCEE